MSDNYMQNDEEKLLEYDDTDTDVYAVSEDDKYDYKSVNVTKKDFSLYELFRKYENSKLILDVDFQRNYVWKPSQKNELIESIMLGLPLPIFYFKQDMQSVYITVDGKQRLAAIFQYMKNEYPLKGLKIMKHLEGKKFSDLNAEYGIYQSQLEDYQIYAHIILPPTPDKILFNIFDRVNRGGTKLNKQEIRNALYNGPALKMIKEITNNEKFIKATNIKPQQDKRMKGSYLITRFFAFLLLRNAELFFEKKNYVYKGDMDDLLAKTLQQLNRSEDKYPELVETALSCLETSEFIFGPGAFRKDGNSSNPINMNIFETAMYLMYKLDTCDKFLTNSVKNRFYKICASDEYKRYINRGGDTPEYVKGRFDLMDTLAEQIKKEWN